MTKLNKDIFTAFLPHLDIHGFDRETAAVAIKDFINENIVLGKAQIVIIHGNGLGILRKTVATVLRNNNQVLAFKTNYFNTGSTLVTLKLDK